MKVYAFKYKEEEVLKSSSGGAFIALCEMFIKINHKKSCSFYGCIMTNELEVEHKRVTKIQECHLFQGSKYVRSNINGIYQQVEEDLKCNYAVMFSGTPCQVNGLKIYLQRKMISTENLLLVDLICHGSPKRNVWTDYKNWLEEKYHSKLTDFSFRYKPAGWNSYPGYAKFQSGKELINTPETSIFSVLHMKGLSIDKSCFECKFANLNRVGDITLGDFWGIEKEMPNINYRTGTSLVLSNSEKGDKLLLEIKENEEIQFLYKIETDNYINYQHNLKAPTKKPQEYEDFWISYKKCSFNEMICRYVNYGIMYKVKFGVRKMIKMTPIITLYRKYIKCYK